VTRRQKPRGKIEDAGLVRAFEAVAAMLDGDIEMFGSLLGDEDLVAGFMKQPPGNRTVNAALRLAIRAGLVPGASTEREAMKKAGPALARRFVAWHRSFNAQVSEQERALYRWAQCGCNDEDDLVRGDAFARTITSYNGSGVPWGPEPWRCLVPAGVPEVSEAMVGAALLAIARSASLAVFSEARRAFQVVGEQAHDQGRSFQAGIDRDIAAGIDPVEARKTRAAAVEVGARMRFAAERERAEQREEPAGGGKRRQKQFPSA
jgi:hypothetical protein